ncbi:hypothetical protein I3843_06G070600 [Carya illinoinensis]|uniref:SAM domain-containing protein n=2 Tax=Carya illinoinensis TaxID=32201 RepID=A0A8T1Q924_CARIL|nr:uncharacterized protein LOC122313847 isoform X1 [Carya illinoinensis]KAG6650911.1 hypothetical protein CIPAW_06G075600 [Carya illinoinensis]KAG7974892.1 hypothetical protein I3843_06G070600 [Carya illinoinensis]
MAETSRDRVTITLGRSGQVIKRAGQVSNSYADSLPAAGAKRSVRDRLGSNVDGSFLNGSVLSNKRRRGDISMPSLSANGLNGNVRIGRDDLRFKLMQKNASRRAQGDNDQKGADLREKLSRTSRRSVTTLDSRQCLAEPKDTGFLGRIPSTRRSGLPRMDSARTSYSTWTLDHLRKRSPDRALGIGSSRGLSPPRNMEEQHRRPLNRTADDVRSVPFVRKDVFDTSRPIGTANLMAKPAIPPVLSKPVLPPLGQLPPPTGIGQKVSYMGDEQKTVDGLLHSLGLGKYVIIFKAEEVDMAALKQMRENDLKELGIPMGPRKKILLALLPPSKRQP